MRTESSLKPHYVILGAGISGLALGWYLKARFGSHIELTIVEKENRSGGWINTQYCNGFLFETGPRSCRTAGNGIATLQLIESLGLQNEVIVASPEARQRFLYTGQALHLLPSSLYSFLTSKLTRNLLPQLCMDWIKPTPVCGDESIDHFISTRLGAKTANFLVDPLVTGIYAGDIKKLSMQGCFPGIYDRVAENKSFLQSLPSLFKDDTATELSPFVQSMIRHPIFTLRHGMETLTKTLQSKLSKHIKSNCVAKKIEMKGDKIGVCLDENEILADRLFCTLPSHAIQSLLESTSVPKMSYASTAVVNMGWKGDVLKRKGFGYLVPSKEKEDILGVVWDSSVFPQQNCTPHETRLTVMLGGMHRPDIPFKDQDEIIYLASNAVKKHLGIIAKPDALLASIAINAIPQYSVGHLQRLHAFDMEIKQKFHSKMQILGSSWHGVSVNDCIKRARQKAEG